jgi:hypothetical protein
MDGLGVPQKLKDDRMGHADGSIGARYSHITAAMRRTLGDGLTERWNAALHARKVLAPRLPRGCARPVVTGELSTENAGSSPKLSPKRPQKQLRAGHRLRCTGPQLAKLWSG